MYICKYFKAYELVDPKTYKRFGEDSFQFFNPLILKSADGIREYFDSQMIINNWFWGGNLQWRGIRTIDCNIGAHLSLHRFACAIDFGIKGYSADVIRKEILENKNHKSFKHITCIEENIPWVHIDCRNIKDRIRIVYP